MPVTDPDRRALLAIGAAATGAATLHAAAAGPPFERLPLWPAGVPGVRPPAIAEVWRPRERGSLAGDVAVAHVATPTLTRLRPARPNGATLLLIPGGGYREVAIGKEGYLVAQRFAAIGYTCYALLYRQPADGWAAGSEAPLQDAQRALRVVRAAATGDGLDPARIAVIGFSAGGHLAAWLTMRAAQASYKPRDAIDAMPLGVAAAALIYPVIALDGPFAHAGSRQQLIGDAAPAERLRALSMDEGVAPSAPPAFLAHALDDRSVPYQNSLAMVAALRARASPAECHLFEDGGHGFGLGAAGHAAAAWPDLCAAFFHRHGV